MTHYWSILTWVGMAPGASHYYLHVEDEHTAWVHHIPCASWKDAATQAVIMGRAYRDQMPHIAFRSKRSKYR